MSNELIMKLKNSNDLHKLATVYVKVSIVIMKKKRKKKSSLKIEHYMDIVFNTKNTKFRLKISRYNNYLYYVFNRCIFYFHSI